MEILHTQKVALDVFFNKQNTKKEHKTLLKECTKGDIVIISALSKAEKTTYKFIK